MAQVKAYSTNKAIASLVLILLTPFVVICVYTYMYIDVNSKMEFKSTMSRFTANASRANIETPLNEIKLIFRSLSANIDEDDFALYIKGENSNLAAIIPTITDSAVFFNHVTISDANDKYRSYPNVDLKDFSPKARPWYPSIAEKDVINFSDPYESVIKDVNNSTKSSKEAITTSVNLFNKHSEFIGNIAFDLDLKAISANISNKTPPYNGKFIITSSTGEVIISHNKAEVLRKHIPAFWIEQAVNVEGEFYDSNDKVYVFYRSYENPDWYAFTIVKEADYMELSAGAKRIFWIVVLSCMVFYLIMIFLAKLYMEQIISRLYMGINGLDAKKNNLTINSIYENIQKSRGNLEQAILDATTDGLTNIYNRRKLDDDLSQLVNAKAIFYLAIVDIDNFKTINDTYGHDTGDVVLQGVSAIGSQVVGDAHHIYRFGGEELCVIYTGEDHNFFHQMIETWLQMVSLRIWREPGLHVTFSAGIAKHSSDESVEQVLKLADARLYHAKHNGKNQVVSE
jgi:diguanylate cyclase (GGDEF)-like protein